MRAPRRLHPVLNRAQEYLFYRDAENDAKARKNKARDIIKEYIAENGEPDEDGHLRWEFDPVTINDVIYKGFMNQRRVSTYIDEDKALELAEKLDILADVVYYEPAYDWDRLYVLNQEGKITDEELDALIIHDESWAIMPIKS